MLPLEVCKMLIVIWILISAVLSVVRRQDIYTISLSLH